MRGRAEEVVSIVSAEEDEVDAVEMLVGRVAVSRKVREAPEVDGRWTPCWSVREAMPSMASRLLGLAGLEIQLANLRVGMGAAVGPATVGGAGRDRFRAYFSGIVGRKRAGAFDDAIGRPVRVD